MNQNSLGLKDSSRVFGKNLLNLQTMAAPTGEMKHHHKSLSMTGDSKWGTKKHHVEKEAPELREQQYRSQLRDMRLALDPLDQGNYQDPQMVAVYAKDITDYCVQQENVYYINPNYMTEKQTDINPKMRAILIDWLVDVQVKFKLLTETLYLTVCLIDRYLSKVVVTRQQLQLVGVTCLFIACKYEEIYSPELKDFVYVTDNAYNKNQMLEMEGNILTALDFRLCSTSPLRFYERLQQFWGNYNNKMDFLAQYVLELALLDLNSYVYTPSVMAAAVIYLVNKLFKRPESVWTPAMERCIQLSEKDIRPCAKMLCGMLQSQKGDNKCG